MNRLLRLFSALLGFVLCFTGIAFAADSAIQVDASQWTVTEDGRYTSMEEVALYLHTFGRLPANFLTKSQAQNLGWNNRDGNLGDVAPGMSIGGDRFGNYEGILPDASGRKWTECDIDSDGGYRNGKRIVFSNDGLIYYSDDHYNSFRPIEFVESEASIQTSISESGVYTCKEDVAAYLREFGHLPSNYITRDEAKALGWSAKKNNLGSVAPGKVIGGDSFGNREGLLPDAKGRKWFECDVNVTDGKRGKERIVWSNDGLIYYTPDNHKSFEQLD